MKAKIYDFDPAWSVSDGSDDLGEYIIGEIELLENKICGKETLAFYGGVQTRVYKLLDQTHHAEGSG